MYTTCLFCHSALGANEAVEHFPVGRRLAFDSAKGRLWVVCLHCQRWNLTPLEERWEAVEECERLYREAAVRTTTDNVGLAQLPEGLDLVRVGRPERLEMAAWRWGSDFLRRRERSLRRENLHGSVGILYVALLWPVSAVLSGALFGSAIPAWLALGGLGIGYEIARKRRVAVCVAGPEQTVLRIRAEQLSAAQLVEVPEAPDGVALRLSHVDGTITLAGDKARRALASVLAALNRAGGSRTMIDRAAKLVETEGDPRAYLRAAARQARQASSRTARQKRAAVRADVGDEDGLLTQAHLATSLPRAYVPAGALPHLVPSQRLALEMAVSEDSERRALMDGELAELETAWREAEEIARIADGLLLPTRVTDLMRRHRGG